MSSQNSTQVTLRIICITPPEQHCGDGAALFGLQDKSRNIMQGRPRPDGSLQFEFQLEPQAAKDTDQLDWRGKYVHGTARQRFLYLSLGCLENDQWQLIKRLKIPLMGITWQAIENTLANEGILEATINGVGSGTVPLLGDGWVSK